MAASETLRTEAKEEVSGVRKGLGSVCCIFATCAEPDYAQPWSQYPEEDVTGSGFVVEDAQGALSILTNEHVIKHARDVRIRPHGSARKYKCTVVYASAERDLALLRVDDATYWTETDGRGAPLRFSEALPELYSNVAVVGYPMGGDNVCVTRGVVSRLDAMSYGSGRGEKLLVLQIDAAINSGNSGGPALDGGGDVVGIAFSGYAGSADNIGYIIPSAVARNFLLDARVEESDVGLCSLGLSAQQTTNPALRRALKMPPDQTGLLVTRIAPTSSADGAVPDQGPSPADKGLERACSELERAPRAAPSAEGRSRPSSLDVDERAQVVHP